MPRLIRRNNSFSNKGSNLTNIETFVKLFSTIGTNPNDIDELLTFCGGTWTGFRRIEYSEYVDLFQSGKISRPALTSIEIIYKKSYVNGLSLDDFQGYTFSQYESEDIDHLRSQYNTLAKDFGGEKVDKRQLSPVIEQPSHYAFNSFNNNWSTTINNPAHANNHQKSHEKQHYLPINKRVKKETNSLNDINNAHACSSVHLNQRKETEKSRYAIIQNLINGNLAPYHPLLQLHHLDANTNKCERQLKRNIEPMVVKSNTSVTGKLIPHIPVFSKNQENIHNYKNQAKDDPISVKSDFLANEQSIPHPSALLHMKDNIHNYHTQENNDIGSIAAQSCQSETNDSFDSQRIDNANVSPFFALDTTTQYNYKEDKKSPIGILYTAAGKFPMVLYSLLTKNDYPSIISWYNDTSFIIHNPSRFEKEVMRKCFKASKWASFLKQLNLYGFKRMKDQGKKIIYYHTNLHFCRCKPDEIEQSVKRSYEKDAAFA